MARICQGSLYLTFPGSLSCEIQCVHNRCRLFKEEANDHWHLVSPISIAIMEFWFPDDKRLLISSGNGARLDITDETVIESFRREMSRLFPEFKEWLQK